VKLFSITQKPPGNELSTYLRTPDQAGWPTNNSQGTTFSGNFKITESESQKIVVGSKCILSSH